ncbi:hypothetical protein D5086_013665 [Populus alba]|uniref:Uncharacterized protein n=1 Tax=Populus alba TaxID=43335 RepID=A0ACC4C698_POPAL
MEEGNTRSSKFKRLCVFCGSNSGNRQVFSDAAIELGDELVKRKIELVYGGGSVGLMGLISQKVYDGGCHVLGVIPKALMPLEISGQTVGEVRTVVDMHERKAAMAKESDAFIALPGGYGTMEELLEMITWSQLGIHKKPVTFHSPCLRIIFRQTTFPCSVLKLSGTLHSNTLLPTNRLRLVKAGIWSNSETMLNNRMHSEGFGGSVKWKLNLEQFSHDGKKVSVKAPVEDLLFLLYLNIQSTPNEKLEDILTAIHVIASRNSPLPGSSVGVWNRELGWLLRFLFFNMNLLPTVAVPVQVIVDHLVLLCHELVGHTMK